MTAMRVTTFDAGDGRALSFLRRGEGAPVLCVPGGPGFDPAAYVSELELPGRELIVLAPRGTGASTEPPSPDGYRTGGYVDDLEALRAFLGLGTVTVLGFSHGATVALAYAARHPDRVTALVLVGAPTVMDETFDDDVAVARQRFADTFPDGAQRLAASDAAGAELPSAGSDERRRELLRTVLVRHVARLGTTERAYLDGLCVAPLDWRAYGVFIAEMAGGLDLLAPAARIAAPALVVAGRHDAVIPPAAMRRLADALPDSIYVELAEAGHFAEVEASECFTAHVIAFLETMG